MAIAFDAKTKATPTGAGSSSITFSHTVTGTNPFLILGGQTYNFSTGTPTPTATYNGTTMTVVAQDIKDYSLNNYRSHQFYLKAPSTGANNVVMTATTGTGVLTGVAVSYTGVDQTSPFLTSGTFVNNTDTGASLTVSLTTSSTGWWFISGANVDANWSSGGGNTTNIVDVTATNGCADSNGDITAQTGNATMNFSGGTRGAGGIAMAFKAAAASSVNSNFLMFMNQ